MARHGVAPCGARRGGARQGKRGGENGKELRQCVCAVCGCVWQRGRALAACVGGRLARSFVGGGVVWVWLNVDVDGGGGGEGRGSRMKGKRKKNDSWLDEWKEECIVMQ
jgi:hypothetical protein